MSDQRSTCPGCTVRVDPMSRLNPFCSTACEDKVATLRSADDARVPEEFTCECEGDCYDPEGDHTFTGCSRASEITLSGEFVGEGTKVCRICAHGCEHVAGDEPCGFDCPVFDARA